MLNDVITNDSLDTRSIYLAIIESITANSKFHKMARDVVKQLEISDQKANCTPSVLYDKEICYKLLLPVAIGRSRQICDIIPLGATVHMSRLHVIILPVYDQLYIVDMGSLSGITVTYIDCNDDPVKMSTGPDCKFIVVKSTGPVMLDFGNVRLAINPKLCIICFERPRTTKFSCGHYVSCSQCTAQLNRCPVCREGAPSHTQLYRNLTSM
jgi:hypothetical protein